MTKDDIAPMLTIERQTFSNPWSQRYFETSLASDNYALVARYHGHVVGYGIAWVDHKEMHIVNLAVPKDYRHRGIGKTLLGHLLEFARQKALYRATLEVRMSNTEAIALYESQGFRKIALDKGYYLNPPEDAVIMMKELHDDNEMGRGDRKLSSGKRDRRGSFWDRPWVWLRSRC